MGPPGAEHFRRLENLYHTAPCNAYYRPRLAVENGRATVRLDVRREFHHAAHALHGSVYFKVLDDCTFFAVNSLVPGFFVLTASFQVDLLRPVTEGSLEAVGEVVHAGRNRFLADGVCRDGEGRVVARGRGTFLPSDIPLTPAVGYALPTSP